MLPKPYRLRRSADIRHVRHHGRRWHHPLLLLFTVANNQDTSRFAISVSKRVGNAVVRNRARRRVREALRSRLSQLNPGWDCLFIVRDRLPAASYSEIENAVCQLLTQAGILNQR